MFTTPKPDLILYSITVFFVLFFIWASVSELEEVTRGNGKVIASSKVQVIQNLEGGIVRDLYVKIGQKVQENEVLLKLDDTEFLGDLNAAKQQRKALESSLELLREELNILEPLVESGVEPRINLIRLMQRISTAESKSPSASTKAFLQSIIPAPVAFRSLFTSAALIFDIISDLGGQSRN